MQIERRKEYLIEEVSRIIDVDIPTIRTWRDLGVFSEDKSQVHRLKVRGDENTVILGKDLIEFLGKIKWEMKN